MTRCAARVIYRETNNALLLCARDNAVDKERKVSPLLLLRNSLILLRGDEKQTEYRCTPSCRYTFADCKLDNAGVGGRGEEGGGGVNINGRLKLPLSRIACSRGKLACCLKFDLKVALKRETGPLSFSGRKRAWRSARAVDARAWTKWSYFASVPCLPFCLFPSGNR